MAKRIYFAIMGFIAAMTVAGCIAPPAPIHAGDGGSPLFTVNNTVQGTTLILEEKHYGTV